MKKTIMNSIVCIMFALISSIIVLTTGCGNNKSKIQKDTPFAFIPYECKVIGKINVASVLKIEGVSKHVEDNSNLPYMKEIKAAGLDLVNIESVIFGIELNSPIKNTTSTAATAANGVVIINAKSKINLADFIKIAETNNERIKFKTITIEDKTAYILPAIENNTETYIIQLNDKLIAAGTQKDATKAVELINNKGKSILDDTQIMRLSKNTGMPDMLWIATAIPDGFVEKTDKNTPNIKDGIISVNYLNDSLKIGGIVNCATKEDAQKVLLPFQMASSFIIMSSKNAIKPEDISIKADNTVLSLDINLTKETLEMLLSQNNNKQGKKSSQEEATAPVKEDVLMAPQESSENTIDTDNTDE